MAGMGRLEGRVAIVTGAAGGIGEATARRLAADGAWVALADVDAAGLRRVGGAIEAAGREVLLVVEDDLNLRMYLARVLRATGYHIDLASTGREAIERVERNRDALVVLDLGLPDLHGLKVCHRIRTSSLTPILILSGADPDAGRHAGLRVGADDYLIKPVRPADLLERVAKRLAHNAGAGFPAQVEALQHARSAAGGRRPEGQDGVDDQPGVEADDI